MKTPKVINNKEAELIVVYPRWNTPSALMVELVNDFMTNYLDLVAVLVFGSKESRWFSWG